MADMDHVATELGHVLHVVKRGLPISPRAGDDLIDTLNVCAFHIRNASGAEGEEAEIVNAFKAADAARKQAAEKLSAYFWPLVKAVKTEDEAKALLNRIPADAVLKAYVIDHFTYVSGVLPKKQSV